MIEDEFAREHAVWVSHEELEYGKLLECECHFFAADVYLPRVDIEPHIVNAQFCWKCFAWAASYRADARQRS